MPDGFLKTIEVEPVGRWFLAHWERLHSGRGLSTGHDVSELSESESEESDAEEDNFEDDIIFLRSLDPKEAKDQDHYKVLGISKLRYKATDDQIRKAYRYKVLRHHPDKRRALGEDIREDDDYFTCITKAFEILGVPSKRRAYDSVDPDFDDIIPDQISTSKQPKKDFFETFVEIFEKNARWSTRTPVPKLGKEETSRNEIEKFYKFWYAFESWREYSYLDEEDKESGSDRDERRWIEKNNRVQRAERKKEEMKRIRTLVDNAYNSDPRIIKFREAEKQEKEDRKKAKVDAAKARKAEEERIKKEAEDKERAEKEAKEQEEKKRMEAEKREREIHKKALKKERRELKNLTKEHNFFCSETETNIQEEERVLHMTELDKLCEILSAIELEDLNGRLKTAQQDNLSPRSIFIEAYTDLNAKLEKEKLATMEKASGTSAKGSQGSSQKIKGDWSNDELALLIKAVNLFPAGTNQRWEVVANFVNQHTQTPSIQRNAKETLAKAKELQSVNFHLSALKEDANKRAYENLEKQQKKKDVKVDNAEASIRTETAAEVQGINVTPWSAEEQKLLEQALKTYPASVGVERWEKISDCLPNRSKKDCMKRYKEIAEIVRAKKAAQAAAKSAAK
jgi:DnaJ family protein C protein 2